MAAPCLTRCAAAATRCRRSKHPHRVFDEWVRTMDFDVQDSLMFFAGHMEAYPLFAAFEKLLLEKYPQTKVKLQKSQISYYNRHLYACISFMRVKKKSELPPVYFVLTLGLPYALKSPRVAVKSEPYQGRWTTHFIISSVDDLNGELLGWIDEAYDFAQSK